MSNVNAPSPRSQMMAVWTGTEMIVWAERQWLNELEDGARYNPETDTWTRMSLSNAPAGRFEHTAVWTGTEMIIFGGLTIHEQWISKNTGARYNPATDTWTTLPTDGAPNTAEQIAVWTGTDMLVWGGRFLPDYILWNTGAKYNLASNTWTPITHQWSALAPDRTCGGVDRNRNDRLVRPERTGGQNDGGRYDPCDRHMDPHDKRERAAPPLHVEAGPGPVDGEGLLAHRRFRLSIRSGRHRLLRALCSASASVPPSHLRSAAGFGD